MRILARHGTGLAAVGQDGVRFYTAPPLGPDASQLARNQARVWADARRGRMKVARRMYALRLGEILPHRDIAVLRGIEGARVKENCRLTADKFGLRWHGRRYDRANPLAADLLNQAINHAASAVEGAAAIAVAATATIPQLGFIHWQSGISFVLDIADLFRDSVTVPGAGVPPSLRHRGLWPQKHDRARLRQPQGLPTNRNPIRQAGKKFPIRRRHRRYHPVASLIESRPLARPAPGNEKGGTAVPDRTIEERFRRATEAAARRTEKASGFFRSVLPLLHGDVPTFMEAPPHRDLPDADIVVFGLPYEGIRVRDTRTLIPPGIPLAETQYARDGAHEAPDAIRLNSLHYSLVQGPGLHHFELGREFRIAEALTIADAGNLPVDLARPTADILHDAADRILECVRPDGIPFILGGDDIVPYVGLRAVARQRPGRIAVIKFDAHFDLCWEPQFWAGSAWARAMEAGYLAPENLAIIGIRGLRNPTFYHEVAKELGVPYWTMHDIDDAGIEHCVAAAVEAAAKGADRLYLSFDVDVMDPAFLPAQKYPEPSGMTAREAVRGIRAAVANGPPLAGFDIACLAPRHDVNGLGTQLAARIVVEAIAAHGYRASGAANGGLRAKA